ncbi:MAG: phosphatase PAP2 family protein [Clostridia bacterium]|nr:phosphatase PAP2 family protein [Clostridia bacterium]
MESILNFDLSVFEAMNRMIDAAGSWLTPLLSYVTWLGDGIFWIAVGLIFCIPKKTRKIGIAMLMAQAVMLLLNNVVLKSIFSRTRPFALFNPEVANRCVNGYDFNGKHYDGWMKAGYIDQVIEEMKIYGAEFQQKWLACFSGHSPLDIGYPYAHGYSFPSGHTSSSFAAACGMFSMCKGKGQKAMGCCAIIVAALIGFTRIYLHVHYCTDVLVGALVGIVCAVAGYFLAKIIYNKIVVKIEDRFAERKSNKAEAEA